MLPRASAEPRAEQCGIFYAGNTEADNGGTTSFPDRIIPIVWNGSAFSGSGQGVFKGTYGRANGTIKISFSGQIAEDKALINFRMRQEIQYTEYVTGSLGPDPTRPSYTVTSVKEARVNRMPDSGSLLGFTARNASAVLSSLVYDVKLTYHQTSSADEWSTVVVDPSRPVNSLFDDLV